MKNYHNYQGKDVTCVICAYKECPYLEESIKCLVNQTVKPNILISTSTPNDYINSLAKKYNIEVRVNSDGGQIKDYNFAMKQINTELGMIAHQDDLLQPKYVESCLKAINKTKKPIIAATDYLEIHNDKDLKCSKLIKIKHILVLPLRTKLNSTKFGKRLSLRFGNAITHPSVMCVMKEMPEVIFLENYKATMDFDLWERLSKQTGSFVHVPEVLLYHRMNNDNQTVKLFQETNVRYNEEKEIFERFWPKPIAKLLMSKYKDAQKYY